MKLFTATVVIIGVAGGCSWAGCLDTDPALTTPGRTPHQSLRDAGFRHFEAGQYEKALACYQEALQLATAGGQANRPVIAADLNDIAVLSEEMGRNTDARTYYAREIDVLTHLGDAGALGRGQAYMERAGLSLAEGSFSAAEADYKKAIALLSHHTALDDPRTPRAMAGLGRLYAEWGKYDEAATWLRKARERAQRGLPQDSPDLITLYDAEASLLFDAGKFAQAEKEWQSALGIAKATFGEKGTLYTALLLHLGQLYTEIGDYRSAETMLQQGVTMLRNTSGGDGMDQAIMTSALANLYNKEHNYALAEPLFQEINGMLDHCDNLPLACAAVRTDLGDFYMVKSQWQAAESEYQTALRMRERILGDHPLVASSLFSLSRVMRKLKHKKEAKSYQARAEAIMALPNNALFFSNNTVDVRSFREGNN